MIKPLMDRVVIRRIVEQEDPNKTIITPELYRQQSRRGTVIAVGQGVVLGTQYFPLTDFVNVGDIVFFGEYNAEPHMLDGEEVLIVRVQDIRFAE